MDSLDSPPITFPYLAPQKSGSEIREVLLLLVLRLLF